MQIHELNTLNRLPKSTDFIAIDTGFDTAKIPANELFASDEIVAQAVTEWLDAHPEATTTVLDHSLTYEKLINGTLGFLTPEMFGAKGDGVTDDTAAMKDLFDAASTASFPSTILLNGKSTYLLVPEDNNLQQRLLPITRGVHVIGNGATIKIADNTDGYSSIIGHGSADLTGLCIEGVTFDCNSSNTKPFTTGNVFGASVLDSARQVVLVKKGYDFVFKNNVVKNSACTNCITYSGDGNTANCIIDGNSFLSMGKTPNALYHDHSTLYLTGNNIRVVNNYFEGESWGIEGTTCAIEVHPGNDCIVMGNSGTKYLSAINYAGVYETDSVNGLISGNSFECLRHFIIIFGTKYSTHQSGYSIDGLVITGNQGIIKNAEPLGNMTGGPVGVGGIIFYNSLTLPVRNVMISNNLLEYEVEDSEPDYTASYGALGIMEASAATVYENVIIEDCTILNNPLGGVSMGSGNGVLKNCAVNRIKFVNPCTSKLTTWNYAYRRCFSARPKSFEGSFTMGGTIVDADKDLCVRPFVLNASSDSTGVIARLYGDITWNDPPSDGTNYKLLTKYSDNIIPLYQFIVSEGSRQTLGDFSPFTAVKAKAGSYAYRRSDHTAAVYSADGTSPSIVTPSTAADFLLAGSVSK